MIIIETTPAFIDYWIYYAKGGFPSDSMAYKPRNHFSFQPVVRLVTCMREVKLLYCSWVKSNTSQVIRLSEWPLENENIILAEQCSILSGWTWKNCAIPGWSFYLHFL